MQRLDRKKIALGVSGSIAAFKAATLCNLLRKEGASVSVVLTEAAAKFVGAATFAGLSGKPVFGDMFDRSAAGELHIQLGTESDLLLIAPATADIMARLAAGRASDLLSTTALCARCPILLAPAMHPTMWSHPATSRNVSTLISDGRVRLEGPVVGEVATGEVGLGRMSEPESIVEAAISCLSPQDLRGKALVVSAGPTVEDLDPIRFLSNHSTGKMGFAVAARAASRGANVTLVAGPVGLPTPPGVKRIDVRSALSMEAALNDALKGSAGQPADALVMTAAVGDFRSRTTSESKWQRDTSGRPMTLELSQNPDILAGIGKRRSGRLPILVGFALETGSDEQLVSNARSKLERKQVDLVVANLAKDGFATDDNRAFLVTAGEVSQAMHCSKTTLADEILDRIHRLWAGETA